ncbi:dienelactone hydrolase family protein [Stutzerimonas stutzeri]|uniref:dienelactone hydrolase family protein n=1 Tax=Stutzerimonas sp. S1 TaxID=3030652 RepID=UPI0022246CD8|nr:dienelactone hydrolase family protein [Stutzerimonas sp. S1]
MLRSVLFVTLTAVTLLSHAHTTIRLKASEPHTARSLMLEAELFRPDGEGPFPAIVLMHGCGGWQPAVRYGLHAHASFLREQGFVVLNLDSFGPRNFTGGKLCSNNPALYKAISYRTSDAFDAMRYLSQQSFVAADNIFLMGQSNGGAVAIRAAKQSSPATYGQSDQAFRGVVAFYPWCGELGRSRVSLSAPLLILAGGRDNWVPARECQGVQGKGATLEVKVYPNAAHSFDLDLPPQSFQGKLIGGDTMATTDSRSRMLQFLVRNLTREQQLAYAERSGRNVLASN